MINIAAIKPNPRNPRKIGADELSRLAESIERDPEFMRLRPIVVDADGMIIGGNQRYAAICEKLNMAEIPDEWIVKASSLTDEQKRRFIVVDNGPAGMSGEWDMELLSAEWQPEELEEIGLSVKIHTEPPEMELDDGGVQFQIIVECDGEQHQAELMKRLGKEGIKCRPLML